MPAKDIFHDLDSKDSTEEGVAADLEKYGVPKDKIVLAFKSPALRKYTENAA